MSVRSSWLSRLAMAGSVALAAALPRAGVAQALNTEFPEVGEVWLEGEFFGYLAPHNTGGFETYTMRARWGTAAGLELGLSTYRLVPAATEDPTELQPGVKLRLLDGERHPVALAAGATWHLPLSHVRQADGYGIVFAVAERALAGEQGPSLGLGGYTLLDRSGDDSRRGLIVSGSQQLADGVTAAVEWVSGDNYYGYLTPTVTIERGQLWTSLGWGVGNESEANSGPFASFGMAF